METNQKSKDARFLKSCLIFLLSAVLFFLLVYSMIAFVRWQANPALWTDDARFVLSMFGGFMGIVISALVVRGYHNSND